jgi:hypothetical protein
VIPFLDIYWKECKQDKIEMLAHDTYCSTVHNIQAMETTQMLYNG